MDNEISRLLADYLHNALSESERSAFEMRLRDDAMLQTRLATLREMQQQLKGDVSAEINSQTPPSSMTFAAISADVQRRRPAATWRSRFASTAAAFVALAILFFAVAYSLPDQADVPIEIEGGNTTLAPPATVQPAIIATPSLTPTTSGPTSIPSRAPVSIPDRQQDGGSSIPAADPSPTPEVYNFSIPDDLFVAIVGSETSTINSNLWGVIPQ